MSPSAEDRRVPEFRARVAQAAAVFRRHRATGACVAPLDDGSECGAPAIGSHLIPRVQLETIAGDGHVMALKRDLMQQWLEDDLPVGRVGIGAASTFPGFCAEHDAELFRAIDSASFALTDESAFLLAYRALVRELVARRRVLDAKQAALGMPEPEEMLDRINEVRFLDSRMEILGWRDMEQAKLVLDSALLRRDNSAVRWAAWTFASAPPILASSHVCPGMDLGLNPIQDPSDEGVLFFVATSILAHSAGGVLHMAWFRQPGAPNYGPRLVRSFAGADANRFLIWLLLWSESVFWSEAWWESLGGPAQFAMRKMAAVPPTVSEVDLVDWKIDGRHGAAVALSRRWPPPFRAKRRRRR